MKAYNLCIAQGSQFSVRTYAQNSDGSYINLSGFNARGQVRYNFSSTGVLLNLNPVVHPSYISGIVDINISGSQTTGIPCTESPYDIEIFNSDESCVVKILRGYASFSPEVTR